MPDPDLEIRGGPRLQKKNRASVGLKIRDGGQAPQGPSPGSATDLFALSFFYPIIE